MKDNQKTNKRPSGQPFWRRQLLFDQAVQNLIHRQRRLITPRLANNLGRNASDGFTGRNIVQHHRPGRNPAAISNLYVAQNLGPGADQHTIANLWMALVVLFPGTAKPVSYASAGELMDLLAGSDRVRLSITWKLTQFSLGRPLVAADARIVNDIHKASQEAGGTYASLITAIVLSDLVQTTRTEE